MKVKNTKLNSVIGAIVIIIAIDFYLFYIYLVVNCASNFQDRKEIIFFPITELL